MQCGRPRFDPWVGKILWRKEWKHTLVFLPGEFHGQRSLAGYSTWGHRESDTTEQLSLSLFMSSCSRKYMLATEGFIVVIIIIVVGSKLYEDRLFHTSFIAALPVLNKLSEK